jgi:hypothetical protein
VNVQQLLKTDCIAAFWDVRSQSFKIRTLLASQQNCMWQQLHGGGFQIYYDIDSFRLVFSKMVNCMCLIHRSIECKFLGRAFSEVQVVIAVSY